MAETAAQLAEHVLPRLPVRQWVLSVPKLLRYFLQTDHAVQNLALHGRQRFRLVGGNSRLKAMVLHGRVKFSGAILI